MSERADARRQPAIFPPPPPQYRPRPANGYPQHENTRYHGKLTHQSTFTTSTAKSNCAKISDLHRVVADAFAAHCSSWLKRNEVPPQACPPLASPSCAIANPAS